MNGVSFSLKKYMNGSCFSLSLVYEWVGVRGLQSHIRTQNHGKLPPLPRAKNTYMQKQIHTWSDQVYIYTGCIFAHV